MIWLELFECFVLLLLLMAGVWLTVKTRFLPFLHPGKVFSGTIGKIFAGRKSEEGFSAFEAAATSLAGTMGTGNIVGVASALALGGPGAVFWMVVGALAGMCTKYAEIVLGICWRQRSKDGEYRGGPMYYLSKGAGWPRIGWLFALLCAASALGMGNMTQVNAAASAVSQAMGRDIPGWITGGAMALFCLMVASGGARRVGKVTAFVMPALCIGYLAGCGWVILRCRTQLPEVLMEIWRGAFGLQPLAAGAVGYTLMRAVRYGLARGVFSHEAGLGSAPIAHAGALCESPQQQGLWGIVEVFFDTVIGCSATALVLLLAQRQPGWTADSGGLGADWVARAFSLWFGKWGSLFVSGSLVLFAAASLISWWFYGGRAVEYLFGDSTKVRRRYLVLYLIAAVAGAALQGELVWQIADLLNCCMALPNLLGVVWLYDGKDARDEKSRTA